MQAFNKAALRSGSFCRSRLADKHRLLALGRRHSVARRNQKAFPRLIGSANAASVLGATQADSWARQHKVTKSIRDHSLCVMSPGDVNRASVQRMHLADKAT